jgi:hypothetical protein
MSKKRKIKIPLWLIIVLAEILVCVILFDYSDADIEV